MLRINLLPPYIYEGAKRRNVVIFWSLALAAIVGGLIYYKVTLDATASDWAKKTAEQEPIMNQAQSTQKKADEIKMANAATKQKTDFVVGATKYNTETYPPVLDNVNNYTISRVLYSSMAPANQSVTISAYAPSLADVGHYMLAMEKNPNISGVAIGINSIPGFPVGASQQQTGTAGFGGNLGGLSSGGGSPDVPMLGGLSSTGGGGGGGMMSGGGRSAGAFGGAGGFGGGQQATGVRPPGGGGHDFTVTLTLRNAIPPAPSYPGAGGGGGGAGGGGMMSGGGGMMSGGGGMMSGGGGGALSGEGGVRINKSGGRGAGQSAGEG